MTFLQCSHRSTCINNKYANIWCILLIYSEHILKCVVSAVFQIIIVDKFHNRCLCTSAIHQTDKIITVTQMHFLQKHQNCAIVYHTEMEQQEHMLFVSHKTAGHKHFCSE